MNGMMRRKAILIVQLVMLCLGNVLYNNYRPLVD